MSTDVRNTITISPNVWTTIPGTGLQVFHTAGHNVAITEHNSQAALGNAGDLCDWRVRLDPQVHNQLAGQEDAPDDDNMWYLGGEVPQLLLVTGTPGQYIVADLTAQRYGDSIPWAQGMDDRQLAVAEAMTRLALNRLEEVRRARETPAP